MTSEGTPQKTLVEQHGIGHAQIRQGMEADHAILGIALGQTMQMQLPLFGVAAHQVCLYVP